MPVTSWQMRIMLSTSDSGSSTATFADNVRIPSKMLKSITGVLPVAINTIMVSPTARPKPIMVAEKIPGLAHGNTTLINVCHGVAPSANEPDDRCLGTLNTASSEIENIIGITANPIVIPIMSALR